ncbi:MAG: hypothetical protein ABIJ09_12580 [Pseudomonadota bacterium]
MRRSRHSLILLGALVATVGMAEPSDALRVERRQHGDLLVAEVVPPALLDATLRERLKSGLTNRLVYDGSLAPEGLGGPLYKAQRTVQVVFDLWEERYLVEIEGAGPRQVRTLRSLAEVEKLLHEAVVLELGSARQCEAGRRYRVDVILRINPISQEVMERSREMMASSPDERGGGQSRSLFGSVARVFFNVSADTGVRELRGLSPFEPVPRPARKP